MTPVAVYVFGTTFRGWLGVGIAFSQKWKHPYHVGLMFDMGDDTKIGFEASFGKNGFIKFPFMEKAQHYSGMENARIGRTIRLMRIPLSDKQIETLFIESKRMVKSVERYPQKWRMVWKLLHQRKGWPMMNTKKVVDCSEGVGRLLFKVGIDLRDKENPNFDSLSPSEIWDNLKKQIEGEQLCHK